jgi:hypothetical protein
MPLSSEGISIQIVASIAAYNNTNHSINDCKVVLSRLIHAFTEITAIKNNLKYISNEAKNKNEDCQHDHVVPVNVIMELLFAIDNIAFNQETFVIVSQILEMHVIIVRITKTEHAFLKDNGVKDCMPTEFSLVEHKLYKDLWSRYKKYGLYSKIIKLA